MPFFLHITDADRAYIDSMPLSPQAWQRVEDFIETGIMGIEDGFRLDPANRPGGPGEPLFEVRQVLCDVWGDRHVCVIRYVVAGTRRVAEAVFGVLTLVYVEHT
jgi:hypothetical protein